mgnify:CR=1 FL=1
MKDLVWDHNILSIGVDEIDEDHQRLLDLFNILNHSVTEGAEIEYLAAVLDELINCTIWHFSHEERLMLKYDYENIEEHKQEHQELVESVRELQVKILQAGRLVNEDDLIFLERWLTEHILSTDMKLGTYLVRTM